jgi:hypothetical protein
VRALVLLLGLGRRDVGDAARELAVAQRDARVRRGCERRGHPRHDLELDSGGSEILGLLRAAAEQIGVAALEPCHRSARLGLGQHASVDIGLTLRAAARTFADEHQLGVGTAVLEQVGMDQRVVQHHIGLGQPASRSERDQLGVTGAGPQQIDLGACGLSCG